MKSMASLLRSEFQRRRKVNPRYSLRAFAKYLNINFTSLSLYMRGKRELSLAAKEKIKIKLEELGLAVKPDDGLGDREEISLDTLAVVEDWYYFAILSLAEVKNFDSDPEWIARRLNISVDEASEAVERLLRLGMLVKNGKKVVCNQYYRTPDNIPSSSIRKSHTQAFDLARQSLERDPVDKRSFLALTLAIDPAKVPEAHKRIASFLNRLSTFLGADDKTEVYRLSTQLYPLSSSK